MITALTAVVAIGACASSTPSASSPERPATSPRDTGDMGDEPDARFPVTIDHMLGSATIPAEPQRVVALGTADQDIAMALGVTPVAMIANPGDPSGRFPWTPADADLTDVVMLPMEIGSTSVERIVALEPDLILATTASADASLYDQYAGAGVPIIAPLTGPVTDSWQDVTLTIGRALRREDAARDVVASVEAEIASVTTELPGLAGRTFVVGVASSATQIRVVSKGTDTSARLFHDLGMVVPADIEAQENPTAVGAIDISYERIDLLHDADAIFLATVGDSRAALERNGVFASLPAVTGGRYLPYDQTSAIGLRVPTPLSVPYLLEQIRPTLALVASSAGRG